jgi:hypothetical protein
LLETAVQLAVTSLEEMVATAECFSVVGAGELANCSHAMKNPHKANEQSTGIFFDMDLGLFENTVLSEFCFKNAYFRALSKT